VVSRKFTAHDTWADPAGPGLCPACAWAYTHPALRQRATLVTSVPAGLTHPDPAALAALLREPLSPAAALAVPLRPGRKHVLPDAAWGQIATGDARLAWTAGDARRMTVILRLRGDGFGSRMLAQAAPPFPALRRLDPARQAGVLADWQALAPWRARRPWLDLALRVTIPPAAA
jgi:hypothetical protein